MPSMPYKVRLVLSTGPRGPKNFNHLLCSIPILALFQK